MNKRPSWMWMILFAVTSMTAMGLVSGCGQRPASTGGGALPPGVMSAAQACRQVVGRAPRGFFTHAERVHLVLTTYTKGEVAESQGDVSGAMPPRTLVWVVEVHAKAIHWNHSVPYGYQAPARPDTDFSVVMNARTGQVSDQGECTCWPLPLAKVGTVVSLPPQC
jgi:hypothetical protein